MKNKKSFVFFLILALLTVFLPISLVHGEETIACGDLNGDSIITVYADLTGECQTIQEAIDVAVDGDTVQVYSGTYQESLEITGKSITISGDTSNPANVIIDSNYAARAFDVHDVTGVVTIEGFTMENGISDNGAGIDIYNAGIGISDCIFHNNTTTGAGGAVNIILLTDDSYIERSKFYSNRASGAGGTVAITGLGETGSELVFKNNLVYENESVSHGGAIYVGVGGYGSFFNNTFVANKSDKDGGAMYLYGDSADLKIQNNIFYDNKADYDNNSEGYGGAIYLRNYLVDSTITYNDFYTNDDNDIFIRDDYKTAANVNITNQTYNPSFTDLANDDYTLTADSMLIDLGEDLESSGVADDITGKVRPIDGDGDEVFAYDIGAYEYGDTFSDDVTEDELAVEQTYCEDNGGTYETRTFETGDPYYMCVFPDTSECEAEVFYAGLCAIGDSLTTTEPSEGDDTEESVCGDFPDVDAADFTEEQCSAIGWVQTEGIFTGNDNTGELLPGDEINRAETTKVLIEAFGFEPSESAPTYDDVVSDAWYTPYIMAATEAGIVEGYSDGTFKPENTVNKVEMLKIILETAEVDLSAVDISQEIFTDVPVDESTEWYRSYVYFAYENGLVDTEGTEFNPNDGMLRQDVILVLYRLDLLGL